MYDNVGVNFLRPTNKTVRFVVDNPKIPKLMSGKDGLSIGESDGKGHGSQRNREEKG